MNGMHNRWRCQSHGVGIQNLISSPCTLSAEGGWIEGKQWPPNGGRSALSGILNSPKPVV
jgi:hypothetical protein